MNRKAEQEPMQFFLPTETKIKIKTILLRRKETMQEFYERLTENEIKREEGK